MNLQFSSIADRGDSRKERLVLKAAGPVQVGDYVLFRALVDGNTVTTSVSDTYWFPDKTIGTGDLVVLYSRAGKDSEKVLDSGRRAHFLYWHRESPMWNDKQFAPVLLRVADWSPLTLATKK